MFVMIDCHESKYTSGGIKKMYKFTGYWGKSIETVVQWWRIMLKETQVNTTIVLNDKEKMLLDLGYHNTEDTHILKESPTECMMNRSFAYLASESIDWEPGCWIDLKFYDFVDPHFSASEVFGLNL